MRPKSFATYADEIYFGWVLSHCPRLSVVELGRGSIHNIDQPSTWPYEPAEAACAAGFNLSVPPQVAWLTGHAAYWQSTVTGQERVTLASAAVHHVVGAAQWRRVWVLSSHWSRVLAAAPRALRRCVFGKGRTRVEY